jgi:hypothetical protein
MASKGTPEYEVERQTGECGNVTCCQLNGKYSSAHLLWIRLCAMNLTVGKTFDSKGKILAAQKRGT